MKTTLTEMRIGTPTTMTTMQIWIISETPSKAVVPAEETEMVSKQWTCLIRIDLMQTTVNLTIFSKLSRKTMRKSSREKRNIESCRRDSRTSRGRSWLYRGIKDLRNLMTREVIAATMRQSYQINSFQRKLRSAQTLNGINLGVTPFKMVSNPHQVRLYRVRQSRSHPTTLAKSTTIGTLHLLRTTRRLQPLKSTRWLQTKVASSKPPKLKFNRKRTSCWRISPQLHQNMIRNQKLLKE